MKELLSLLNIMVLSLLRRKAGEKELQKFFLMFQDLKMLLFHSMPDLLQLCLNILKILV
jgi:hypothetical protein